MMGTRALLTPGEKPRILWLNQISQTGRVKSNLEIMEKNENKFQMKIFDVTPSEYSFFQLENLHKNARIRL